MHALAMRMEPAIRKAFLQSVADIKSNVTLRLLEEAIRAGDMQAVFQLLSLDPIYFGPVSEAVRASYQAAGVQAAADLPRLPRGTIMPRGRGFGGTISARWDGTNPRAVDWVAKHVAELVAEVIEDQRIGIRRHVAAAFEEAKHPHEIALDLVGRVQSNGRRAGGVLGLRSDQMDAARAMRQELSGIPSLSAYKRRAARDRRFDAVIAKAEREGRPLRKGELDRIVGRYEDIMLRKRGETIARTEALAAVHKAQSESVQQQIDSGKLDARHVKKVWSATDAVYIKKKGHTRLSHVQLNGTEKPWGEPFISPATDMPMMHPGDTEHGAKGQDTINCRCHMYIRVDRYAMLREAEAANG